MGKIPATVITGFLGSGKTTLMRYLLQNAGGRRLAVIVNEFGDVGVDAEILRGCGVTSCGDGDIVELANGCICCTVADDFLPALTALLDRPEPPDHILIETSGLALPKPLVKAFGWPSVRTRATVDGVVCVVDADAVVQGRFAEDTTVSHDEPLSELFADQLACADLILLSKADLAGDAGLAMARDQAGVHARAGTAVLGVTQGRIDPAILLGLSAAAEDDLASRPSAHDDADHGHDDFKSFVVAGGQTAGAETLTRVLEDLLADHDILRLKGVVAVAGAPARLVVQALGPRLQTYFDRPWRADEPRASSLVVIGEQSLDQPAIETALRKTFA